MANNRVNVPAVGVLGLGQIGGSLCAALHTGTAQHRVGAFDPIERLCKAAIERSIIDRIHEDEAELIEASNIIVIATHIDTCLTILARYRDLLRAKALVFDVGSIKAEICNKADQFELRNFIGAHPIAGTERVPPEAWDARLFAGARFLYCESDKLSNTSRVLFERILNTIDARGEAISPEENDFQFGLTIGLPHVFAYLLRLMRVEQERSRGSFEALVGPSYRSATRVADSDPSMVEQMLWHNRKDLSRHLKSLQARLADLRLSLDCGNRDALRALIDNDR